MVAGTGTFALTGTAATFLGSFPAGAGSYTLTGQASGAQIQLTCTPGYYALTGNDATLTPQGSLSIVCDTGAFALTGFDANLSSSAPVWVKDTHDGFKKKRKPHWEREKEQRATLLEQIRVALEGPKAPEVVEAIKPYVEKKHRKTTYFAPPPLQIDRLEESKKALSAIQSAYDAAVAAADDDDEEAILLLMGYGNDYYTQSDRLGL
jgi:hypothetical protein